jgi:hypothetical protein
MKIRPQRGSAMPLGLRAAVLVSGMTVWMAAETEAAEYQCRKADSSVRIAVEVKKAGHTLPCEVIAEDDKSERAVLYKAQYDRDYCPSKLESTKDDLESDGWSCQRTSDVNVVRSDGAADAEDAEDAVEQTSIEPGQVPQGGNLQPVDDGSKYILSSRTCRNGGEERLIHIEVDNPNNRKPCELIYWADGDVSKPGQLLWRAEHDADFCPRRLETIVGKWIGDGWLCDADDVDLETAATEPTLPATVEPTPDAAAPTDVAALDDNVPALEEIEAVEQRPVEDGAAPQEAGTDNPQDAGDAALEAIIAADAERIGQWMEVEPDIEIAARGDLNDDGADDAVVFLAYQSDQSVYRQYLMSYLVADDGFELASVKLLTGVKPPPAQAKVEEINEGIIWLTLPGDDGSASAPTGYKLRDQQLIEVDSAATTTSN